MDNLQWLQNWLFQNYDKSWGEKKTFLLENVDNPGWLLTFNVQGNKYNSKSLEDIIIDRTEDDWMHNVFKNNVFMVAGGPFNLNEVLHYFRNWIEEKKETKIIESEIINWMQNWYFQYCDGDWEHNPRFMIEIMDNPGWKFSFYLEDTHCEDEPFDVVEVKNSETSWYKCFIENNFFVGYGGFFNLIDIINVFRNWAEKCKEDNEH